MKKNNVLNSKEFEELHQKGNVIKKALNLFNNDEIEYYLLSDKLETIIAFGRDFVYIISKDDMNVLYSSESEDIKNAFLADADDCILENNEVIKEVFKEAFNISFNAIYSNTIKEASNLLKKSA